MRLSDLIATAARALAEQGDREVRVLDHTGHGGFTQAVEIRVASDPGQKGPAYITDRNDGPFVAWGTVAFYGVDGAQYERGAN